MTVSYVTPIESAMEIVVHEDAAASSDSQLCSIFVFLMVISSSLLPTHILSLAEMLPSSLERKVFFDLEAAVFETIVAKCVF